MLQALLPLALIAISVLPSLDPVALSLAVSPLSDIAVPILCGPNAMPMLKAHVPFTIVNFSTAINAGARVRPLVDALAMRLALLEGPEVRIARGVAFEPAPVPEVMLELALILTTIRVSHHSEAVADRLTSVTGLRGHLADVDRGQVTIISGIVESDMH
jgi:hypothetical protein